MDEFGKVRIDMESIKKKSSADNFVEFVFRQKKEDKGFRADFRHAQSPAQASRAWPYIVPFADIQREIVRTAYVLIGASICWEDAEFNGKCGIGTALRKAWSDQERDLDDPASPAVVRLRKLVASTDALGLCLQLRPLLSLIRSKGIHDLDYARLLKDILYFDRDPDAVKARWISEFYAKPSEKTEG